MKIPDSLPWNYIPSAWVTPSYSEETVTTSPSECQYIVHACNAYPRMVKQLKKYVKNGFLSAEELLKELGEL